MLKYGVGNTSRRMRGFNLVEVMVAVLIIAVGLLGIAKMQALALSDTGTSRTRALVAMEAAGLASVMQADRAYWTSVPTSSKDLTATISGGAVTAASDSALTSPPASACAFGGAACTVAQMAAVNLGYWATALEGTATNPGVVPTATATIDCSLPATTLNVTCTVVITWKENLANSNSAQNVNNATTTAALATPTYTIQVQP